MTRQRRVERARYAQDRARLVASISFAMLWIAIPAFCVELAAVILTGQWPTLLFGLPPSVVLLLMGLSGGAWSFWRSEKAENALRAALAS